MQLAAGQHAKVIVEDQEQYSGTSPPSGDMTRRQQRQRDRDVAQLAASQLSNPHQMIEEKGS